MKEKRGGERKRQQEKEMKKSTRENSVKKLASMGKRDRQTQRQT